MQEHTASAPEGRNYEQLLLLFRPFRAVCLLCIYIALTDYAIQFCPFRALRAGSAQRGREFEQIHKAKVSNSSVLTATYVLDINGK